MGSGEAGSAKEPKFLDLTHLGPKHKTGINVKLPEVETQGESGFRVWGSGFRVCPYPYPKPCQGMRGSFRGIQGIRGPKHRRQAAACSWHEMASSSRGPGQQ